MLALFLTETLIDVLQEFAEQDVKDPKALLEQLKIEENQVYDALFEVPLPPTSTQLFGPDPGLEVELLFKGPNLCRTARLPAQSRFLGHTTNTDAVGGIAAPFHETYFRGIPKENATAQDANGVLRLVYETKEREKCHVPLAPDYKDYFLSMEKDSWTSLTIPNDAERVAYNYDPEVFKGVIILHGTICAWGKCEPGELRLDKAKPEELQVKVNGEPVASLTPLNGGRAVALKGEENNYYWKPNENGVFEVSVRALNGGTFAKISSITLY